MARAERKYALDTNCFINGFRKEDRAAVSEDALLRVLELRAVRRLDGEVLLDPGEVQVAEGGPVIGPGRVVADDAGGHVVPRAQISRGRSRAGDW